MVSIEQFKQLDFRVGKVLKAEPIEGAKNLYRLVVDLGERQVQIVSGIKNDYTSEDLEGKQIIVAANLDPAKFRGVESQGMLLAATGESGEISLLTTDREVKVGSKIS